ncbi:ribose transport system permease protein [Microbacterium terrae]|uniref:Ribose transport system permease protein RbsC n=1 Tax=Microbacterium terrae TaxID=69369 RepID=A0A0M2GVQ4_9MICO|nr:ABC transporter permease [Microbacterium terrae]KJL37612.1 Ribose transport system permease protein RbsC [Microbacterium terrae]MBP1076444.1 ribose transport system permease protein [Microbacterium terrae]GLJ97273.1 sugar ABC transporter permease [Microbacterium terrae]
MSEQTTPGAAVVPSAAETPPPSGTSPDGKSGIQRVLSGSVGRNLGLVVALLVLVIVGALTAPDTFLSVSNILTILRQASIIGVISIGMTLVIIAGGIDLSVGSVMGLASVVATLAAIQDLSDQLHWIVMVVMALLVGLAAGLINGVVIAYGKVVAFMATLAMLVAARGLAEILAERRTLQVGSRDFIEFMNLDIIGVDMLIWIFAIVAALGWVLLNRTTFGRRTVAIGGNREAARLAGINVQRHTMWLYAILGLCAGIAAVMILGRTTAGTSTHGQLYELDAIAAVVVGGTLLVGGRGTITGTVFGVLIFATLTNVFVQNNLTSSVQAVAKGVIIVVAVLLQQRFAKPTGRSS